jgi:hypothetical protein
VQAPGTPRDVRPPLDRPSPLEVALHDDEIDFEEYARSRLQDFAKR